MQSKQHSDEVNMAINNWNFGFNFVAKNSVTPTIRAVNQGMEDLTKTTKKSKDALDEFFFAWNSGVALFKTGVNIIKTVTAPVQEFAEFEHAIAAVGAISQASAADLKLLESAALEAGLKTQFSPTEAAQGLQVLASAGLDANDSIKTLLPVLDLAAASMGELGTGEAASAIIGTMKSFGLEMDNAAGVTDKLMKITTMTNFRTRDFGAGLSKAAASAGTFGFNLNDTLITMGLLRNTGEDASRASTALAEAMRRLATDTSSLNKLNRQGIDVYDRQTGKIRPFLDIMNDMVLATQNMTEKQRNQFVESTLGARGLKVFNAVAKGTFKTMKDGIPVMASGADMVAAMRGELVQATGTTENFRKRMQDTVKGQLILLQGSWQTLKILIGKSIGEAFRPLITLAIKAVNAVITLFTTMPGPIKTVVGLVAKFVAIMGTALGIMVAYKGAAIAIKAVNTLMASSFMGLNISMGPLLLGIGAVVAAILALKVAYDKNFLGFRDGLDSFIKGFKDGFAVLVIILDAFKIALGVVGKAIQPLINLWNRMWGTVNDVGDGAGLTAMEKLGQVVGWVSGILLAFGAAAVAFKVGMLAVRTAVMVYKAVSAIVVAVNSVMTGSFAALIVPMLPFIAAITAIGTAFYFLKKAYDKNLGGFADTIRYMLEDAAAAFEVFKNAVVSIIKPIKEVFAKTFGAIRTIVVGTMQVVTAVVDAMVYPIKKTIDFIWGKIKWLIDKLSWVKNKLSSINPFSGKSIFGGGLIEQVSKRLEEEQAKADRFIETMGRPTGEPKTQEVQMVSPATVSPEPLDRRAAAPMVPIAAQVAAAAPPPQQITERVVEKQTLQISVPVMLDGKEITKTVLTTAGREAENNLTTTVPVATT